MGLGLLAGGTETGCCPLPLSAGEGVVLEPLPLSVEREAPLRGPVLPARLSSQASPPAEAWGAG